MFFFDGARTHLFVATSGEFTDSLASHLMLRGVPPICKHLFIPSFMVVIFFTWTKVPYSDPKSSSQNYPSVKTSLACSLFTVMSLSIPWSEIGRKLGSCLFCWSKLYRLPIINSVFPVGLTIWTHFEVQEKYLFLSPSSMMKSSSKVASLSYVHKG